MPIPDSPRLGDDGMPLLIESGKRVFRRASFGKNRPGGQRVVKAHHAQHTPLDVGFENGRVEFFDISRRCPVEPQSPVASEVLANPAVEEGRVVPQRVPVDRQASIGKAALGQRPPRHRIAGAAVGSESRDAAEDDRSLANDLVRPCCEIGTVQDDPIQHRRGIRLATVRRRSLLGPVPVSYVSGGTSGN